MFVQNASLFWLKTYIIMRLSIKCFGHAALHYIFLLFAIYFMIYVLCVRYLTVFKNAVIHSMGDLLVFSSKWRRIVIPWKLKYEIPVVLTICFSHTMRIIFVLYYVQCIEKSVIFKNHLVEDLSSGGSLQKQNLMGSIWCSSLLLWLEKGVWHFQFTNGNSPPSNLENILFDAVGWDELSNGSFNFHYTLWVYR